MYVELHARSGFSFLEGAALPEQLAQRCAEIQMPALGLLDRDGIYGSARMHVAAEDAGIKAHVGAEVTLANSSLKGIARDVRYPLLAENQVGYRNLCRLITRYKLREKNKGEGFSIPEEIREHSNGLVCLTGGDEGPLAAALQRGGIEEAQSEIEKLVSIFGQENVYVELQRHFEREEEYRNRAALDIASRLRLPILATNGVCYAKREQRAIADVFTCLRNKRRLDTAGKLLCRNSERYLRSPSEMEQLFCDLPDAIQNTKELSNRLEFTLENLGYEFPKYPVAGGDTMAALLRRETMAGARERYGELTPKISAQLEHELAVIEKLDLAGYFLIVWDIVRFCNRQKIFAQGRGSAANSAVCYSLGITAVDSIGMKLLFERFLSEERGEWPLQNLAACGALNPLDRKSQLHRRDALWQVAKFGRPVGPLLREIPDYDPTSVLLRMSDVERLITDHHISGFTIGPHAMAYRRDDLNRMNLSTLRQVKNCVAGGHVQTAGEVTVKQRPGTAKGIVFLTLHDETDFCDVVLKPAVYEEHRMTVKNSKFLRAWQTAKSGKCEGAGRLRRLYQCDASISARVFKD